MLLRARVVDSDDLLRWSGRAQGSLWLIGIGVFSLICVAGASIGMHLHDCETRGILVFCATIGTLSILLLGFGLFKRQCERDDLLEFLDGAIPGKFVESGQLDSNQLGCEYECPPDYLSEWTCWQSFYPTTIGALMQELGGEERLCLSLLLGKRGRLLVNLMVTRIGAAEALVLVSKIHFVRPWCYEGSPVLIPKNASLCMRDSVALEQLAEDNNTDSSEGEVGLAGICLGIMLLLYGKYLLGAVILVALAPWWLFTIVNKLKTIRTSLVAAGNAHLSKDQFCA